MPVVADGAKLLEHVDILPDELRGFLVVSVLLMFLIGMRFSRR